MVDFAALQEKIAARTPAADEFGDTDTLVFDLTPSTETRIVPAGFYDATLYNLIPKTDKNGRAYYRMIFQLEDGAYTGEVGGGGTVASSKGWMNRDLVLALGWAKSEERGTKQLRRSEMLGLPVVLQLGYKELGFQDKPENELLAIYSHEDAPPVPQTLPGMDRPKAVPPVLQAAVPDDSELPF